MIGEEGEWTPKVLEIVCWRAEKEALAAISAVRFRETVMSTIEPDEIWGGKSMEGNSIYVNNQTSSAANCGEQITCGQVQASWRVQAHWEDAYQAFIGCEEHCNTGINLANGE